MQNTMIKISLLTLCVVFGTLSVQAQNVIFMRHGIDFRPDESPNPNANLTSHGAKAIRNAFGANLNQDYCDMLSGAKAFKVYYLDVSVPVDRPGRIDRPDYFLSAEAVADGVRDGPCMYMPETEVLPLEVSSYQTSQNDPADLETVWKALNRTHKDYVSIIILGSDYLKGLEDERFTKYWPEVQLILNNLRNCFNEVRNLSDSPRAKRAFYYNYFFSVTNTAGLVVLNPYRINGIEPRDDGC